MERFCLIVSGGELCELPDGLRGADLVIACDRGWQHAERLGLRCDLVLGDFDSSPLPEAGAAVERFPPRKDDTDTMLAARRALALGYTQAAICCAFGGRLDHTLANIQAAAFLASHGVRTRLCGTGTDALAFSGGSARFPRRAGRSLSVFALSDCCEGVTIRGAAYGCEDAVLTNAFPIGVSNEWAADEAEIAVRRGVLLVMQSLIS